jgi:glycosyltransferase involved in cell wall biosynthesis
VPVVSTRTGIPADLITPGVNGLLAPVDDVDALVAAIDTALSNPDLRASIAAAALADIRPYDWPLVAARYDTDLYAPLQAGARSAR